MLRLVKPFWSAICLLAVAPVLLAFSMWGPNEAFQTQANGYQVDIGSSPFPGGVSFGWFHGPDWSTSPKNLSEEFRWNIPVLYYSYDQSFLDYFGSNGVAAVDSAIAMLNALPPASALSADLSEFPTDELRENGTAKALHMFDLKSAALELLVERLGLSDSTRWAFCIHDKVPDIPARPCPIWAYQVIQRNFDPITFEPSAYVNGNFYTYTIRWACPPAPIGDWADAVEVPADPFNNPLASAVASVKIVYPEPQWYGAFHTSLTRDDVGGLRYLYGTNNVNWEPLPAGATGVLTNLNQGRPLYSSNLTLFAQQALTNSPAGLTAQYPGLVISASTNFPAIVYTTNLTAYFTNAPFDPAGTLPRLAFATNVTPSVELHYSHTFANLVTVSNYHGNLITVPITTLGAFAGRAIVALLTSNTVTSPFMPAGGAVLVTNSSLRSFVTNMVVGEFFLLPTNSCGLSFSFSLLTNILTTTNLLTQANTNISLTVTNPLNSTNNMGTEMFSQSLIQYFTNHVYWGFDVDCTTTNSLTLRQGLDKISFVRRDFDSLLGRFFQPVTNVWVSRTITNSAFLPETVFRVVNAPDIIFRAADIAGLPNPTVTRSTPTLNTNGTPAGLAGPGVIEGQATFTFNKVGPLFAQGFNPAFLDQADAFTNYVWASFDGSTNPPIVYPSGLSLQNLINMLTR